MDTGATQGGPVQLQTIQEVNVANNEQKLIDAGALAAVLEDWEEKATDGTENDGTDGTTRIVYPVKTTTQEILDLIADQPAVDAVVVIRCKDCGKWVDGACRHFSSYGLQSFIKVIEYRTNPDDYCAFAERREEPSGGEETDDTDAL
jgi:hypothetical protein